MLDSLIGFLTIVAGVSLVGCVLYGVAAVIQRVLTGRWDG